jgi:hypothetical protein
VQLIYYYVAFMITGDFAAYFIGLFVEHEWGSHASLIVFLALYFGFLWVSKEGRSGCIKQVGCGKRRAGLRGFMHLQWRDGFGSDHLQSYRSRFGSWSARFWAGLHLRGWLRGSLVAAAVPLVALCVGWALLID